MLVCFLGDFSTLASLFVEKWASFISHMYFVFCFLYFFNILKQFIITLNPGLLQMRARISCVRGLTYKIKPRELRVEVGI